MSAETDTPSSEVAGNATLHGSINPNGLPVEACEFEWGEGESGSFEHNVPCAQALGTIGSGAEAVAVSAELSGLKTDEIYHYRLVAKNANGSAEGASTILFADENAFGFQLVGPNALSMVVSEGEIEENGSVVADPARLDSQAGGHPYAVTTRFELNLEASDHLPSNRAAKDYYVNLPAGFAGSVAKIPRCKMSDLDSLNLTENPPGCPTASQVGVIRLYEVEESSPNVHLFEIIPVYNMVPSPGAPAELAFAYADAAVPIIVKVRADDGTYGVTAEVRNVSEIKPIAGSLLTLWGVPANPGHDMERFLPLNGGGYKLGFTPGNGEGGPLPAGTPEVPFLTNPTKCGSVEEVEEAEVMADSWLHPGKLPEDGRPVPGEEGWVTAGVQMYPDGVKGCGGLSFEPHIEAKPTTTVADSPTGLTVVLKVPQSEKPNNLATPSLENAEVTLPQGVSISPAAANGLEGCTKQQIKLQSEGQPECPNGSQIGRLEVVSPLLPEPLTGQIYLSSERSANVFHIYLVIEGQGVLVKLEGSVEANEETGQLVSKFAKTPQLPFSELKLSFYGGSESALATPEQCGEYSLTNTLEPWSHQPAPGEAYGTPNVTLTASPFAITSGCGNGFQPGFAAGSANPVAGAYTPLKVSFARQDGEQELSALQVELPLGLIGKIASVAECSEAELMAAEHSSGAAQKADPSCPANSEVGTVEAGAGPGSTPFFLPGKAYLTGPYKGAPYGLAVVVPVLAGPFDLGTVVVRSAIAINEHTSQVTVTSDPFPRMLDGIPLRIRRVNVSIDRPQFGLNPTSCEPMQFAGTLTSVNGAQHAVSSRFQVGECAKLSFKPGFSVFTHAGHTRRNGAYLRVKVTSGKGQANIGGVRVELPKILPSRLETLKKACSAKQFAENPAGCPAASRVGTAIAHTPILSTPLTGPAIFVSHGGAAFPDLDIVLQGSGVTVALEGNTNIIKGITISNFKSVPDVPVNSFELTLPQSEDSALAATGNLCFKTIKKHGKKIKQRVKLVMPTTIAGHNGAVLHQSTVIQVQGCSKPSSKGVKKRKKKK